MTIAEVSKKYDISADTLRYYERIGLIPTVPRNVSGYRDFGPEQCEWIEFVKHMRNAGVSIEILIEYIAMFSQGDATLQARKVLLQEQSSQIGEKISELQLLKVRLDNKIKHYEDWFSDCQKHLKHDWTVID